ncbi:MAG: methylthioadenosine phosphorylase [Lentisphaerae bacterium RIFOXYC12_FULL_60_16]|nr:MAG: methylthioadenosine phosphorylase [Lentisphaerae bacterium RIFOXYC12_FULL_60_16]OGV70894.1 MAG: methylthioadenosine phosphorylase [Lentisphaerae bacterium RIFOXYA12_FULL_60_10]OGV82555.1 MAG: methylthioadenosine phosphorylase [Lentisphaerae bacterium RIFOXYB12_FULL_60_10]
MNIGVIGGSGVYTLEGMRTREQTVETPFGNPSDNYSVCEIADTTVIFLPRHGRGHRLLPSEINHRANIYGFKQLGVERILSISAVGSLKEHLRPRDIVLPDQYFDRTKNSAGHTFFGRGIVAHVPFGDPTCAELRGVVAAAARRVIEREGLSVRVNESGTYVNMEGPAFSTRAESRFYRVGGFDVIGMTSLPEAKLCREAGICYQPMSMVTDYDCWKESEEPVTIDMISAHLNANARMARMVLVEWLTRKPTPRTCSCADSLKHAIITQRELIPPATKRELEIIVGHHPG